MTRRRTSSTEGTPHATAFAILGALTCDRSHCECLNSARRGYGDTHCPAHDDRHPSLSVHETVERDRVLWNCHRGCTQDSVQRALTERGLLHAPRVREAGFADPRATPPQRGRKELPQAGGRRAELVPASSIRPEPVEWAWSGRIPIGMLTMLVGEGGAAKSLLTQWLAAGFSLGRVRGELWGESAHVAIASAEDAQANVIIPRLMAAGADLDHVHFIRSRFGADDVPDDIELDGEVEAIEAACAAGSIRVLIIDTVVAHIPTSHNSYKEQDVRRVLKPLAHMAERLGLAVIGVMHLNRRADQAILTRISGSGGFGNLARSVLLMARDPEEPEDSPVRYVAHGKCNVGPIVGTLEFEIETRSVSANGTEIETARLNEIGSSDLQTAQLLVNSDGRQTAKKEAEAFLRRELANGPVPANAIRERADLAGIAERTLKRAKKDLGIEASKAGMSGGWTWALPKGVSDGAVEARHEKDARRGPLVRSGTLREFEEGQSHTGHPSGTLRSECAKCAAAGPHCPHCDAVKFEPLCTACHPRASA